MKTELHRLLLDHMISRMARGDSRWSFDEDPEMTYHQEASYALVRMLERVEGFARVEFGG